MSTLRLKIAGILSILFACGTLQLVTGPGEAEEALRRFHDHLEPGGLLALVALPGTPS